MGCFLLQLVRVMCLLDHDLYFLEPGGIGVCTTTMGFHAMFLPFAKNVAVGSTSMNIFLVAEPTDTTSGLEILLLG